jgi:hypothetical protein
MRSSLPDKVVLAAQKFVMEEMGDKFVSRLAVITLLTGAAQNFEEAHYAHRR